MPKSKSNAKPALKKNENIKVIPVKSVIPPVKPQPAQPTPVGLLGLAPFSHHHWTRWTYLTLAAILVVTLGMSLVTFIHFTRKAAPSPAPVIAKPVSTVPTEFAPDLTGGNRYTHGHFYPVAVMIDNAATARPQSSLQAASVVYEALVEGGITRFMAVFDQGEVKEIGPVRSARQYFLEWLAEYEAAYAHAGGSPEALSNIRRERIHDINGIGSASTAFFRDSTRPAPHNLYTTGMKMFLTTRANNLKYSDVTLTPWTFGSTVSTGVAAKNVTFYFTGRTKSTEVSYTYDATKLQWLRSQAGKEHQDRLTKATIGVTNLVIQRISSKIAVGEKGRLTMSVTGTGKAKIFQQGQVLDVTWSKVKSEDRTVFTLADGTPATFLPGNTWIEVLPEDRTLTVQ
ncbi:MAG: DUF3048 domain-containing protein [bacterium]|nr:DUF3048 domain-containing protein [bacterium]